MTFKATAVLLKYKRLTELKKIIVHLKKYPEIIDEIIVWDNTVINMCGMGRYLGALRAKNDIIFTVDDDAIPLNIPQLFEKYIELKKQGKERIVNNMKPGAMKKYKNFAQTMMGWGSFFPKSSVSVLKKYIDVYGIDELLIRDTSRIYTSLFGKWYTFKAKIKEFPSASDPKISLWMQKNHKINRRESIKRTNYLKSLK